MQSSLLKGRKAMSKKDNHEEEEDGEKRMKTETFYFFHFFIIDWVCVIISRHYHAIADAISNSFLSPFSKKIHLCILTSFGDFYCNDNTESNDVPTEIVSMAASARKYPLKHSTCTF
jgi:hypothetical protein